MASIIAEGTDNGLAGAGIAPAARIMPVKVCGRFPNQVQAYSCPVPSIVAGIEWAVEHGADIINVSIAAEDTKLSAAEETALDHAEGEGVLVVAASGNGDNGVGDNRLWYPAAYGEVFSVGAVGHDSLRAGYSNWGAGEDAKLLDLVAPGGHATSLGVPQQSYEFCKMRIQTYSAVAALTQCWGTSMSAAHVSGVAALVLSRFPTLSTPEVRELLRCSAIDLGREGADGYYGYGLVNAPAALEDADFDNIPDCIDPVIEVPLNDCLPRTTPTLSEAAPAGISTPTGDATEPPATLTPTAVPSEAATSSPTPIG